MVLRYTCFAVHSAAPAYQVTRTTIPTRLESLLSCRAIIFMVMNCVARRPKQPTCGSGPIAKPLGLAYENCSMHSGNIGSDDCDHTISGAYNSTYFPSDLKRVARHQLAAPFTFILMAVTLSTGPVINKILSFRPANVLLVAPLPVGIFRMLFPLGSKAITPCPLLI